MMQISSTISFLFFFMVLHVGISPIASTKHKNIIAETCKLCAHGDPNVNYTLCVESLMSVPMSHHTDEKGLAIIALKLAKSNLTHAKARVNKLLKAKDLSNYVKSCLDTCKEVYSDATSSLKTARKAIKSGKYKDANIYISSALDAPETCEDSFQEGGIKSPLSEENGYLRKLTVISLAITALLK